jgi:hypothetical protein
MGQGEDMNRTMNFKSWMDVYLFWLSKEFDNGFAAHLADKWEKGKSTAKPGLNLKGRR